MNAEKGKRLNKTRMPDQQLRILIIGDLKACDEKDPNIVFSSVINSVFFLSSWTINVNTHSETPVKHSMYDYYYLNDFLWLKANPSSLICQEVVDFI